VTGQGVEFRTVGKDGLEPELFDLGKRLGSAEDPSRHHAGCRRLRGDRPWRGALPSQVGADPAIAASMPKETISSQSFQALVQPSSQRSSR
jgi:hypothetical protein